MGPIRLVFLFCAALGLIGAVPAHIQTADYWAGYAGTKVVPAAQAARWLTWAETDVPGAKQIAPYGVKTILYTDPNRVMPGKPLYAEDDTLFAKTCGGQRARGGARYSGQLLTDPNSPRLAAMWRGFVDSRSRAAHYDAVFADDSVGATYALDQPCNFSLDAWLSSEAAMFRSLGYPVMYNGLNDFYNQGMSKEIVLNSAAMGGMMEDCYRHVGGWRWSATEATEIRMAQDRKYFFCYVHDLTPADQADDARLFTYGSLLLTYDPATTVLWEYYKTPTGAHVMPESQLVALSPVVRTVSSVNSLRRGGVYVREYQRCFISGRAVGPCAAAVNPANSPQALSLGGYTRTLALQGSGVFDGGSVSIANQAPPSSLGPLQAVIAFK